MVPLYKIQLPDYSVEDRPDFDLLGNKIDSILRKYYLGQNIVVRAISSQDHVGKTVEQLIDIIQDTGSDRYDPKNKGDRYENIEGKHVDFFALDFSITKSGEYFKYLLEPFYSYPSKPIRLDVALIYDPDQLLMVEHHYKGREGEVKRDGFAFKYPDKKANALKGLIRID